VGRALLILASRRERERAHAWIERAPMNCRVEFKEAKRSTDQNAKMWACLTDVARQLEWHGARLTADDWKLVFLSALKQELRMVPNIDGTGLVQLGRSSSDLSRSEMSDLIELIHEFGARHGVEFSNDAPITVEARVIPDEVLLLEAPEATASGAGAAA
jgi:hypothetical protein